MSALNQAYHSIDSYNESHHIPMHDINHMRTYGHDMIFGDAIPSMILSFVLRQIYNQFVRQYRNRFHWLHISLLLYAMESYSPLNWLNHSIIPVYITIIIHHRYHYHCHQCVLGVRGKEDTCTANEPDAACNTRCANDGGIIISFNGFNSVVDGKPPSIISSNNCNTIEKFSRNTVSFNLVK